MNLLILVVANFWFFILGNIVWTKSLPIIYLFSFEIPIWQIIISELSFILIYTMIDKGNINYGMKFTIISLLLTSQFFLPVYDFLFYSTSVKYFSVFISLSAILVNSIFIKRLLTKGYSKLLSSRVSTSSASLVEIFLFAFLLNIGIQGALTTILVRIFFITIIPKIFFNNL